MTPEIREELLALRTATATELEKKRNELSALEAEEREAATAERQAAVAYRAGQETLAAVQSAEDALTNWLYGHELKRNEARGRLARARSALQEARHVIAKREREVAQIDALLDGAKPRHVPEVVRRPRPADSSPFVLAEAAQG